MGTKSNKYILSYFAGFFDGEGYVGINIQKHKDTLKPSYRLDCSIGSTNHWILELIKFHFGGFVYKKNVHLKHPTWKEQWVWVIYSNKARLFLEEIVPYLNLKKAEAEIAIKWQSNRKLVRLKNKERDKVIALDEAEKILLQKLKKVVN